MRIGVINKATSVTEHIYSYHRFKTFQKYPPTEFFQYEMAEGKDHRAYSWDGVQVVLDSDWALPAEDPNLVVSNIMRSAVVFGQELLIEFGKENVLMGITQLGKTCGVLCVMSEKVDMGNGYPISLMDTVTAGSLYETIAVIDYHLANMAAYADLAPFITTERLTEFKAKIQTFLG